jgi:hypothetical protein
MDFFNIGQITHIFFLENNPTVADYQINNYLKLDF